MTSQTIKSLHVFLISWAGQHQNCLAIFNLIRKKADKISIVFSDPDPAFEFPGGFDSIKRSNQLFWGDKFKACLDNCNADFMLVIHADCMCDDWPGLVEKCRLTMAGDQVIGVWAPLIDHTPWDLQRTEIASINMSHLSVVAQTDGIVFCLPGSTIKRMKQASYDENVFGWGVDSMFIAHTYATGRLAVIDKSVKVMHPKSRGYEMGDALKQCNDFLKQLTASELIQHQLLVSFVGQRVGDGNGRSGNTGD